MKKMKKSHIIGIIIFLIVGYTALVLNMRRSRCITVKKPCSQFTQQIDSLKKKIKIDSLTLDQVNKDYYELWEENQIFASMLAEIENTEEGHEALKKSWVKHSQK